jgi:hypothetical protein
MAIIESTISIGNNHLDRQGVTTVFAFYSSSWMAALGSSPRRLTTFSWRLS